LLPTLELSGSVATLFGIFVGFFTLLSGGAIGFLVSQFWYLIYHPVISRLLIKKYSRVLMDEFNIKDEKASFYVYNFTIHDYGNKDVISFMSRRWDVFNSLGSTACAIFASFVTGLLLRCCVLTAPKSFQTIVNWTNFDFLLAGFSIFLIIIFAGICYKVANRNIEMGIFVVRKCLSAKKKKLSDYIPKEYLSKNCKNQH